MQGVLGKQFWKLLFRHRILPQPSNGHFPDELLLENGFGFTDLAKIPTPRASDLSAEDIEYGRHLLREKIERYRPKLLCSVYRSSIEAAVGRRYPNQYGLLPDSIGKTRLFALSFPYRATPVVDHYMNEFRRLIARLRSA
jgi:hypothetical protein